MGIAGNGVGEQHRDHPVAVIACLQVERSLDLLSEPTLRGPLPDANRAGCGLVEALGDGLLPTLTGHANPSVQPNAESEVGNCTAEVIDRVGVVVVMTEEDVVGAA